MKRILATLLVLISLCNPLLGHAGQFYRGDVVGGIGDVVGPSVSVDNGLARYDGTTGKLLQGYTSNTPTCGDTGICTFVAPVLGTPTSGVATNLTGLPLTTGVTGILGSANGGTGIAYFTAAGPTAARVYTFPDAAATILYSGGALGTPSGGTATNLTGLPLTTGVTGILPTANGGTGIAYFTAAGPTVARVFTFPDAATTILTTNAAVTVAQGGTGLATLTDKNVILGAGTATPTFVAPGTSGNVLTSNGTTWTSAAAAGGSLPTVVSKTTTYTALTTDDTIIASSGTFTITLYAASGNSGRTLNIKNAGTGVITIDANASETIDGALTQTISAQYTNLQLRCDGTNWHIL